MPSVADQIKQHVAEAGSLLDALDAVLDVRALLALALTFVAFALAFVALGGASAWLTARSGAGGGFLFVLSALVWAGILLVGSTTSGILLADDVWQRERRTLASALAAATGNAHRLLVLLLIAGLALAAYLAVLALALLLCRMPGLGPVLYAVVLPVAVLATGLVLFCLCYLMLPLAAPCVWSGNNIAEVLATLKEVVRHRPLYVTIMFLLLGLMVLAIAGIVGFVIFIGSGLTLSMSVAVAGLGGGFDASGMFMGLPGTGANDGSSYGIAFGLGMTVLTLLGTIPSSLVAMKGAAIIHKGAVSGLAVEEAAADLERQMNAVRRRALEAKERALAPKPEPPAKPTACPNAHCGAPVGPDDAFCTECGERLK